MADEIKDQYAYDPFKKANDDRWGRKGGNKVPAPEIPNYDIIDFLGSGGMATVWSAKYRPLNQPRAIKVLSEAVAIDANFLDRFTEEAKALARLEHPNIVKVYDASSDFKNPYIAMDFVAGKTLSDILKVRGITQDEALKYFGHIAEALDYAHGMGFVHRDIKPSNVMITNADKAMLIDFGVASWLGGVNENANNITGTTRYMSPEACKGARVTKQSDLWAFGVLMYRTLTGSLPFEGKGETEIMNAIMNLPPKEPKHSNPKVRAFLLKVLEKDPNLRFKSAGAMVEELKRATTPFAVKANKEGIAVGASFIMAVVVVIAIVGGVVGYFVTHQSGPKVARGRIKLKTGLTDSTTDAGDAATVADATSNPALEQLQGVWYANFGSEWAEIHFTPKSGKKFHLMISKRAASGAQVAEADGELSSDNKLSYKESGSGKAGFTGVLSSDHKHITGKYTSADGQALEGQWLRIGEISTTPYQNNQLGFSFPLPSGWQATNPEGTVFSPIGRPDVIFAVVATPLNGATSVQDVFQARESQLSAAKANGGSYTNLGIKQNLTVGGKSATSYELLHQAAGGPAQHAILLGVLGTDSCTTVESWWPTNEDDVWPQVLDSMRKQLTFAN